MAAIIESHTTATTGGSQLATLDIDAPAGIQSGDLLVIYASAGGPNTFGAQPVGETGWTATDLTGTTYNEIWTYYKIAGVSEPSTYTIDLNGQYATLHMLRISGVDQTTPIETQTQNSGLSSGIFTPVSGLLSATKAYLSLVFAAVGDFTNQNITGYPTGYTVISETETTTDTFNGLHTALTYKWENNTNSYAPGSFSAVNTSNGWNTSTVVINSATTPQSVIDLPVITPTLLPASWIGVDAGQPFLRDFKSAGYIEAQTTVTVDAPIHEPGDLLFMLLSNSVGNITATGPDGESGWTKGNYGTLFLTDSDYYYKVAGASEPSTYTFTPGGGNDFTLHALAIGNVHPNLANYGFTDTLNADVETDAGGGSSIGFASNTNATVNRKKLGLLYAVIDEGQQFVTNTTVGTVSNGWEVRDIAQGPTISSAYQSALFATKRFTGTYEDMQGVGGFLHGRK
jgi:hypothetical protein